MNTPIASVAQCYCDDPACVIKYGTCHCGCEQQTRIPRKNNVRFRWKRGIPLLFVSGHNMAKRRTVVDQPTDKSIRLVPLTKGQAAIVDADEYDRIRLLPRWRAQWSKDTKTYYAVRAIYKDGKWTSSMMHSEIMPPPDGYIVDHKSRNTLDNRRENLRYATHAQNIINTGLHSNNTTGHRGVTKDKRCKSYVAHIGYKGLKLYLGSFSRLEDAAEARRRKEIELYGEFSPFTNSETP